MAFPADLLATLATIDPARLRPRGRVYLHLHQAALTGHCPGVARVEDSGPVDLTTLAELLAHVDVPTEDEGRCGPGLVGPTGRAR